MKITKSMYQIAFLTLLFAVFAGYNFMFADVPANPPANNTAAPINIGVNIASNQIGQGALAFDRQVAYSAMYAPKYCNLDGTICTDAADLGGGGMGAGGFMSLKYEGTKQLDTQIPDSAFCALTAQSDGGCDTGARCGISVDGNGTWAVDQERYGDCNKTMYCTYSCTGVPANFKDSISYSWQAVAGACTAPYANQCETTYGTITTSYQCFSSLTGAAVSDSNCKTAKPANTSKACSKSGGNSSSC